MDRKKMLLVAVIMVIASLAITCVTANSLTSNTPLYTLRMEQASSKMHFLPTAVNEFAFTAEKGYELTCDIEGNCSINGYDNDANLLGTGASCVQTECNTCMTYCGQNTCEYTCPATCPVTCGYSCGGTCHTCWETCGKTCEETTCPEECWP